MPKKPKVPTCRGCPWQHSDCGPPDMMWYICTHPARREDADGWVEGVGLRSDLRRPDDCPLLTEEATDDEA